MEDQPKRRWHDDRGELSEAIDLLEFIPEAVIPMIAEGLTMKADKEFQAGEILKSLRSMGSDKIMAIHKSQQKRRSYDQNPNLHRIVSYFYILPERNQDRLAVQFVAFTSLVVDYLATCDSFGIEARENDLLELRTLFVEQGVEAAQEYLRTVHEPYIEVEQEGLSQEPQAAPETVESVPPVAEKAETVIDTQGGMKIRKL